MAALIPTNVDYQRVLVEFRAELSGELSYSILRSHFQVDVADSSATLLVNVRAVGFDPSPMPLYFIELCLNCFVPCRGFDHRPAADRQSNRLSREPNKRGPWVALRVHGRTVD